MSDPSPPLGAVQEQQPLSEFSVEQLIAVLAEVCGAWDSCAICGASNDDDHDSLPHSYEGRTDSEIVSLLRSKLAALRASARGSAQDSSAPVGMRCADCAIDGEACPRCYEAAWRKRHPNVTFIGVEAESGSPARGSAQEQDRVRAIALIQSWIDEPATEEESRQFDELLASLNAQKAESGSPSPVQPDMERLLRLEWWMNHACERPNIYGDDGEMQCNTTHEAAGRAFIDFKREPIAVLEEIVGKLRLVAAAKAILASSKGTETT